MQGPDDDAEGGRPGADDAPYTVYGGRAGRKPRPPRPKDGRRDAASGAGAGAGGGGTAGADRRDSGQGEAPSSGRRGDGLVPDASGPGYTVYDAREGRRKGGDPTDPDAPDPGPRWWRRRSGRKQRTLPVRVLRWVSTAVAAWILLSIVLFLISATIHQQTGDADELLGGGGAPFSPTNVLILGTDARPKGSKEPGAEGSGGATRTDTLLLMRTGGFKNSKLSIPRDTAVDIPGHGRQKINAAYAFDKEKGAVQAVDTLTNLKVNHVATIDFQNFPELIDAMGGVKYTAKTCLTADVSGGARRPGKGVTIGKAKNLGGTSFRLKKGQTYTLKGSAALALARVRKNRCDAAQDDVNRAGRQQEIVSAMKKRVLSPSGFFRLPFIAWKAPKAVKTDMSGFSLLGVAVAQFLPGGGSSQVLKPTGAENLPSGQALTVSPEAVERARRKFEK
ncbi:LCP family protein [Patulibacter minatonensis]|uniref:LCP family protein n=1 Tax=Patulibacter minatonensis TaxID=298163 RepID=UPI00047D8CD8|nr:LCP family protein [Patulibacter minatonensis]